jgi:hypothetical protein
MLQADSSQAKPSSLTNNYNPGKAKMFLQEKETGSIVKIMDVTVLFNPTEADVIVRSQQGEEEQDPEPVSKQGLIFPSGESLPRCWLDADYRTA